MNWLSVWCSHCSLAYYIILKNYVKYEITPLPAISIFLPWDGRLWGCWVCQVCDEECQYDRTVTTFLTCVMSAHRDPEKDCPNMYTWVVYRTLQVYTVQLVVQATLHYPAISSHTTASRLVGGGRELLICIMTNDQKWPQTVYTSRKHFENIETTCSRQLDTKCWEHFHNIPVNITHFFEKNLVTFCPLINWPGSNPSKSGESNWVRYKVLSALHTCLSKENHLTFHQDGMSRKKSEHWIAWGQIVNTMRSGQEWGWVGQFGV